MDAKFRNFNTHGMGSTLCGYSLDQASMGTTEPSAKDVALSKRHKRLSLGQIALCRGHLESLVIHYIGWDDATLADVMQAKITELNRYHGPGLADDLWREVVADMTSRFNGNELQMNRGAWKSMLDDY